MVAITWGFADFYRPDLDLARAGRKPGRNPTEVITSAFECSEWRWVRAW